MKIIISPAKSLDFEKPLPTPKHTMPKFLKDSRVINKVIKKKKPKELMELMSISDKLADLNWQRNKVWKTPFTPENARPAMYAFAGDVYIGLDSYSIAEAKLESLQDKLRITFRFVWLAQTARSCASLSTRNGNAFANRRT